MVQKTDRFKKNPQRILAFQDKDSSSLALSASGGAFAAIARVILEDGGVVFGSAMELGGYIHHIMIDSPSELGRLQGSKYSKSNLERTIIQCCEMLRSGRKVLFSGTPCQIFALGSYLEKKGISLENENLLTCDLICHGVTRPGLFEAYIHWLEKKNKAEQGSLNYIFRSKQRGWGLIYRYTYISKAGKDKVVFGPAYSDRYYKAYLSGYLFEKRCYSCPFATKARLGDFTLGDYWGIEKQHPNFPYKQGASLVFLNTGKAENLFESSLKDQCLYLDSTFEKASKENSNLLVPSSFPIEFEKLSLEVEKAEKEGKYDYIFNELLCEKGFKAAIKKILPRWLLIKLSFL